MSLGNIPILAINLLGDFNQLPEGQLRTYPLKQTVTGPTRNSATLNKIFTNIANWYCSSVILPAVTKSDHNTVLLTPSDSPKRPINVKLSIIIVEHLIPAEKHCCAITSST